LWLPFLGRECSCSSAPALFALRYHTPLYTCICYRTSLAHWRIEVGARIPTLDSSGEPRPVEDITQDINLAFEKAVRRDPANWFWVHRRWKPMSAIQRARSEAGHRAETGSAEEEGS
jgi:KDO2-lipid IV(A) lauroyltransferase